VINMNMKINEVTNNLFSFIATVRVILRDGTTIARTCIIADGINQARLMLAHIYGISNVLSLNQVMNENLSEVTKTLSATELQVKTLTDKSKQLNQQAKRMKARQGLQKAQEKLQFANKPLSES